MLPYFELRTIPIGGGRSVAVFGVLVVIGIAVGIRFAHARARALGIGEREINTAMAWALLAGFLGSHVEVLLLHQAGADNRGVWGLVRYWNGMSAVGGFFGALVGLTVYFGRKRRTWLVEADILMQALVLGWVFGRLGCTVVHDHIGRLSVFPLAIRFPDGPRHDLGFYEFLYTLGVLVPAVLLLNRRQRAPGTTIWVIVLLYAPVRFVADFLRNTDLAGADVRYLGLTPAQYACVVLTVIGVAMAWRLHDHGGVAGPEPSGPRGHGV